MAWQTRCGALHALTLATSAYTVEACLASRPHNGGLVELSHLVAAVRRRRGAAAQAVSEDDVLRAIGQLRALGGGWDVLTVGAQRLVRSVPTELSGDGAALLSRAADSGGVLTQQGAVEATGWTQRRVTDALEAMLKDGLAMLDTGDADGLTRFWFPSLLRTYTAPVPAADAATPAGT